MQGESIKYTITTILREMYKLQDYGAALFLGPRALGSSPQLPKYGAVKSFKTFS